MLFCPQNLTMGEGRFNIPSKLSAVAHSCFDKDVIKEFWSNFTYGSSSLEIHETEELIFKVGDAECIPLLDCEYSVNVENGGFCISAEDKSGLLHGFMALLDLIKAEDGDSGLCAFVDACKFRETPLVKERMVHFCIFPETELWELQKFLRFTAALKYTHVILEFWGTLKYDVMRELAWESAFTKEEIRPIIREAVDLGVEIIPMFNHWGHAAASRARHGKHVVLDQNPALQTYFTDDGWCWDIGKPKVRELLRSIRRELIDLCGSGRYFHIGCDEAYNFAFTEENMNTVTDFINEVSRDLSECGRRAIAWGDMFLYRYAHYSDENKYECNAPSPEASRYLLTHLDKSVVIADWQYDSPKAPVETSAVFAEAGFDSLICPWDKGRAHTRAAVATVKEMSLKGIMHTTWHTLSGGMPIVALTALECFTPLSADSKLAVRIVSAALMRKVMPAGGDYAKAGWSKIQTHYLW